MSDATIMNSGTCGEHLKWTFDDTGTLTICGEGEMEEYNWSHSAPWEPLPIQSVVIENGVTSITPYAFRGLTASTISIPDSVVRIDNSAFYYADLSFVALPNRLQKIARGVFECCEKLTSVTIPKSVTEIETDAFFDCHSLSLVILHENIKAIDRSAFDNCYRLTVVCTEDTYAHHFCEKTLLHYIFDYQFDAFHGTLPLGVERLTSPFQADEEKPFLFVSYSHKDRDIVLNISKNLFEAGWKIWYDEGLTIGDRYNETLEEHVKNCAVFLLFVSPNSVKSSYINCNEIPWAQAYDKPIIKCMLSDESDFIIDDKTIFATISPAEIEDALCGVGLSKGTPRIARGISVVVDPANRIMPNDERFAYCLYTPEAATIAQTILLDARKNGCNIYDALKEGGSDDKLQDSACFVVFLDRSFLSTPHLVNQLSEAFAAGKDIAICQVESFDACDIPSDLEMLYEMQWLNYTQKAMLDLNVHLIQHLQKCGCRSSSVLPNFSYEQTDEGIIITRYTGLNAKPHLESEYNNVPVIEIAAQAFSKCIPIESIVLPDSIKKIGSSAFYSCSNLSSITLPKDISRIETDTFRDCSKLSSVVIPNRVTYIGDFAFLRCNSLTSVTLDEGVQKIGSYAFGDCSNLTSVVLPNSLSEIAYSAFRGCTKLTSIFIPNGVTEIGNQAFQDCEHLVITTYKGSYAEQYANKNGIPVKLI